MIPMIRSFVLAAVATSATAAFAFDRVKVNVPFSFETQGITFPAGTYNVESAENHYSLTLSSRYDTKISFTWIAIPAEFGPHAPTLSLNFNVKADGTRALRTIRLGPLITPILDPHEGQVAQPSVLVNGVQSQPERSSIP